MTGQSCQQMACVVLVVSGLVGYRFRLFDFPIHP